MPSTDTSPSLRQPAFLQNAVWQLEVCNACRYCEGFCGVFPALERRQAFNPGDLQYLANLCHDCRACFYACMYAPPHEFGVNIPLLMSQVRAETYADNALPPAARRIFGSNGMFAVVTTVLSALFFIGVVLLTSDPGTLFGTHVGEGAFYRVIPYPLMFIPALVVSGIALLLLLIGGMHFLERTHGQVRDVFDWSAIRASIGEVLGLRYLRGGGAGGCTYPSERPSFARVVFHQLVFYGFLFAAAATALAFFQQDVLGWYPPFPLLSWPVVLGSIGGIAMIVGCAGLLYLKWRADRAPADGHMIGLDYVFLIVLVVVNVTGMLLLVFRETAAMGSLLVIHLATVFSLYFASPYGKFAHVVYRYAALLQNRIEERREH